MGILTSPLAGGLGQVISSMASPQGNSSVVLLNGAYLSPYVSFSRASGGTYFDANGVIQTAADNAPRFTGPAQRLIIEESRTNLFTQSADMNAAWVTKSGVTVTSDALLAPDGTNGADLVIETTANADHYPERAISVAGNQNLTFSIFLKAAGRSVASLVVYSSDYTQNMRCQVGNLNATPTLSSVAASAGLPTPVASVSSVGNGWHRVILSGQCTTSATATVRLRIQFINGSTTYLGDGVSGVAMWGGKLSVGGFATSYMPAAASAVTRAADNATADLGAWFRQGAGTIIVEAVLPNGLQTTQPLISINDGNAANDSNSITLRVNSAATNILGVAKVAGVQTASGGVAPVNPTNFVKAAIAWDASGFSVTADGVNVQTSAVDLGSLNMTKLAIGRAINGAPYANAEFAKVRYERSRLSNAALMALTAP